MGWDPLNAWPAGRRGLWMFLALVVLVSQGGRFLKSLRPESQVGVDFFQEWGSARNWLQGKAVYASLTEACQQYLGLQLPPGQRLSLDVNAHPPTSILFTLPFGLLDYPDAVLVWNLLSLAALALSLGLVVRQLQIPFAAWSLVPVVTLLLVCGPLREQVQQGQLNLVLLLLLTSVWAANRSGRNAWAGVFLGTATAIKLFPAFLFFYFAFRRQGKVLASGILTLVALTGLTAAVLGPGAYRSYAQDVLPTLAKFRSSWNNLSLIGFSTKLFDPAAPEPVQTSPIGESAVAVSDAITVADATPIWMTQPLWQSHVIAQVSMLVTCGLVLTILARVTLRSQSRIQLDLAFSLALIATLLVSPITWEHYCLILLVPWTLIWLRLPRSSLARGLFLCIMVILWMGPEDVWRLVLTPSWSQNRRVWGVATPLHTLTLLSLHCYALLGLGVFLVSLWRKTTSEDEPAKSAGESRAFPARFSNGASCADPRPLVNR
jgi:hypothetical protein